MEVGGASRGKEGDKLQIVYKKKAGSEKEEEKFKAHLLVKSYSLMK